MPKRQYVGQLVRESKRLKKYLSAHDTVLSTTLGGQAGIDVGTLENSLKTLLQDIETQYPGATASPIQ